MKKFDLEDRLIEFADKIIDLVEILPESSKPASHLGRQVLRSGTAPALLYGEVQGSESQADFIHKNRLILKELRETQICNKLINKRSYVPSEFMKNLLQENGELVAIFTTTIQTATRRKN